MEINLNGYVRFKVTDFGRQKWDEFWARLPECAGKPLPFDSKGFVKLMLWQVMMIWGRHTCHGCRQSIENNVLILQPEKDREHGGNGRPERHSGGAVVTEPHNYDELIKPRDGYNDQALRPW